MFDLKFKAEIEKEKLKELDVKPLTIIHIADLERLSKAISSRKWVIWDLLKANFTNSLFPKPFNLTLNRKKNKSGL